MRYPKPNLWPAHASTPLPFPHMFFEMANLYKILPCPQLLLQNLTKTFCFRAEIGWLRLCKKNCELGEGFVKICHIKNACVGEGGELKRVLDDAFGIRVMVWSCCEKHFEKELCKRHQNCPTVLKVFENKFGQVVKNLPTSFCVCLVL